LPADFHKGSIEDRGQYASHAAQFFSWAAAIAASLLAVGGIALSRSARRNDYDARSKHARRAVKPIPPDMLVVVSEKGKLFHLARARSSSIGKRAEDHRKRCHPAGIHTLHALHE